MAHYASAEQFGLGRAASRGTSSRKAGWVRRAVNSLIVSRERSVLSHVLVSYDHLLDDDSRTSISSRLEEIRSLR